MARKNKKTQGEDQLWDFDNEIEVPAVETKAAKKRARRAKFFFAYAVSACVLLPVAAVSSYGGWMQASEAAKAPIAVPDISSPAKGDATKAVTEWINRTPSPVPGGSIQSWDGFKTLTVPPSEDGKPVPTYEIHNFTLVSSTGRLYKSSIQMAYSDTSGVQILGDPSLVPFAPEGKGSINASTPWPGHDPIAVSNGVKDAVGVWAAAYTGGDPAVLRQTVGDPDSTHAYVPLAGIQKINNVSVSSVAGDFTEQEETANSKTPARVVARVNFEVLWVGQEVKTGSATSKVTYDLLIDKANTGAPVIVAWGGPGEGFDLEPYSNALVGREVVLDDTIDKQLATVSPSAVPTTPAPTAAE